MSSNKENNNEINNSNQVLETARRSSNVTSAAGGAGNRGVHNRIGVPTSTTKSFADLPDSIFCIIIEYLDWYEVARFDTALLDRSMRNSYLVALKLRKVKVERNELWKNALDKGILSWLISRNIRVTSWDLEVDDTELMTIANGCPQLQSLNISDCHKSQGFYIRGCYKITDAGIRAVARGCPQLQSLDIRECHNITDAGIRALATGCPQLQSLNTSGCSITAAGKEIAERINYRK